MQAFIVRPFGIKQDIDFEKVERELIQPALKAVNVAGATTAKIVEAGNIREDMFSQLLLADLVIADLSIHNANVFYELGIRHALRDKKTFLIRSNKDEIPFDLKSQNTWFLASTPLSFLRCGKPCRFNTFFNRRFESNSSFRQAGQPRLFYAPQISSSGP